MKRLVVAIALAFIAGAIAILVAGTLVALEGLGGQPPDDDVDEYEGGLTFDADAWARR